MKFFHAYTPHFMKAYEKNGLLNKDSGIKIQHSWRFLPDNKFNEYAKPGTPLYNLIKDTKMPCYVDRICGGTYYHYYPFDKKLIDEYKNILGNWFLGFQYHESGSNRRRDEWFRVIRKMGHKGPYDVEEFKQKMLSANKTLVLPDGTKMHSLTQDSAEYFATLKYAETYQEFVEEMKDMFRRKMVDTHGNVLPCDSFFLATKIQNDMGMQTFMPEVGADLPMMRVAVALARGVATAYGKTWGNYYEAWKEDPTIDPNRSCGDFQLPVYALSAVNEWQLRTEEYLSFFGPKGGSSRLLQNRIYHHSYMSGADYFSEEWGSYCSYTDLQEFTLSDYGMVKKNFINHTLELGNMKAKIPFAIILPQEFSCIEIPDNYVKWREWKRGEYKKEHLASPLTDAEVQFFGHVEDVLKHFYARVNPVGNESDVLANSGFGDLFDIVYDDTPIDKLQRYEYVIDSTKEGNFAKKVKDTNLKVLDSSDIEELKRVVNALTKQIMPCYVDGTLLWLVSNNDKGEEYLSIFNNEGNQRDFREGDIIDHNCDETSTITFKETTVPNVYYATEGVKLEKVDDKTYKIFVPATGMAILKI